jgi:DNA-binding LacI/PurR family transcriptional regulator
MMNEDGRSPPLPALSPARIREVSVAANVAPGTVKRVIDGLPTKPSPRERVIAALRKVGLGHYVPAGGGE